MNVSKGEKLICCFVAVILLFLGMSVAMPTTDSSFLRANNVSGTVLRSSDDVIDKTPVCTLSMLNDVTSVIRGNMTDSMMREQYRAGLLFLVVGVFLQYLFYYQSAECKEDGQLFSCRTVVVDYIHLKDSGE